MRELEDIINLLMMVKDRDKDKIIDIESRDLFRKEL